MNIQIEWVSTYKLMLASREIHVGHQSAAFILGTYTNYIIYWCGKGFSQHFGSLRREPRFDPPRYNKPVVLMHGTKEVVMAASHQCIACNNHKMSFSVQVKWRGEEEGIHRSAATAAKLTVNQSTLLLVFILVFFLWVARNSDAWAAVSWCVACCLDGQLLPRVCYFPFDDGDHYS